MVWQAELIRNCHAGARQLSRRPNEKTSQAPSHTIPEKTSQRWQTKATSTRANEYAMLPHHERIFLQNRHVIERRLWQELEQQPADMGVEKTLLMSYGFSS